MIEINFNELTKNFILLNQPGIFKISKDNCDFYFKIHIKDENNRLLVFSNGAFNRSSGDLPVFMRNSWVDEFEESCIFIDDKTIHNGRLALGWGVGEKDRHYIRDYSEIVMKISDLLNFEASNIYYYGSSAGGFMSMMLASLHKKSIAIVNNPQIYINNYNPTYVKRLYDTVFPGLSTDEILSNYLERLSLSSFHRKAGNVPKTFYLQNYKSKDDIENHYNKYITRMTKYNLDINKIIFILYNNEKLGHNPINKAETIRFIKSVMNNETYIYMKDNG